MKIYSFVKDFSIWDYYSLKKSKLILHKISQFPFVQYPNGIPCFEANLYLLHLVKKGHSTLNKGSISKYASNISHLISYCYSNNITKITNIKNHHFIDLIKSLTNEINQKNNKRIRQNNQVITIGNQCIDFLFFVQNFYSLPSFIGTNSSCNILVTYKSKKYQKISKNIHNPYFYTHSSFPHRNNQKTKLPISFEAIQKLRSYIKSKYDRPEAFRNLCIIEALEFTGARRNEICLLSISDVIEALESQIGSPLLKLTTLKNKKNSYRYIPVPRNFLENLSIYIRYFRKAIISKTIGVSNDHGQSKT